jgi:hypothetical protein
MAGEDGNGETRKERVDRELIELLNEIRVALPGVQVLFAFLLTVPFASGWSSTTELQRDVYVFSVFTAALATAFMIAPSSYHRLLFRQRQKEHMLFTSNLLLIVGMAFLAMSMIGCLFLVVDYVLDTTKAVVAIGALALVFLALWYALPLSRRNEAGPGDV